MTIEEKRMQRDKQELMREYCRTRDIDLRNELALQYLYLPRVIASRFSGRGIETEDLFQVASIALLRALERFDCEMGLQFTTFAVPTLAGEVRNYLRDKSNIIRLPRRGTELLPKIRREQEAFFQENQRMPTVAELALRANISQDHVIDALEMMSSKPVSLDFAPSPDETPLEEYLGREEEAFEDIDTLDMIQRLLSQLEGKSRFIIEERFFRQRSQRDVASALGISQMQVSRLERKALERLRGLMA